MKQSKKYGYRIKQVEESWRAEITRRKTAKETLVTKTSQDFASEQEAEVWAKQELLGFQKNQADKNKVHAGKRAERAEIAHEKASRSAPKKTQVL